MTPASAGTTTRSGSSAPCQADDPRERGDDAWLISPGKFVYG